MEAVDDGTNEPARGQHGGAAGGGGYDFQALAIAYIASHVLARTRLEWLASIVDVPTAIAAETKGPGDDIRVAIDGGSIDIQAKKGLNRTDLREVIRAFASESGTNRLILAVDERASRTVSDEFRGDLNRLRDGRRDGLHEITTEMILVAKGDGSQDPFSLLGRVHVVVLHLENEDAAHRKLALAHLREVVELDDHRTAWALLTTEGRRIQKTRGGCDRASLIKLLVSEQVALLNRGPIPPVPSVSRAQNGMSNVITVASSNSESVWDLRINEAVKLIRADQPRGAHALLCQILKEAKEDAVPRRIFYRLHTNIGACLVSTGDLASAHNSLRKALDYEDGDTTARGSLAQATLLSGDRSGAAKLARGVLERDQKSNIAWLVLIQASDIPIEDDAIPTELRDGYDILAAQAFVAARQEDLPRAADLFRRALQKKRDPQILIALTKILFELGDHSELDRYSDEAVDGLRPTENFRLLEEALLLRANLHGFEDQHHKANELLVEAQKLAGHSALVECALAENLLVLGQPRKALDVLQDGGQRERDNRERVILAFAFARLGEVESLRQQVKMALAEETDVNSLLGSAEAALAGGLDELARDVLNKLRNVKDYRVALFQARLDSSGGEKATIEGLYREAIQSSPEKSRPRLRSELGKFLAVRDDYEGALKAFEETNLETAPEDVRRDYARTLFDAKEGSRLAEFLRRLKISPRPLWLVELEARLAFELGDWSRAASEFRILAELQPGSESIQLKLAASLLSSQQMDEATAVLLALLQRDDLAPEFLMEAAHLLVPLGRPVEALDSAFLAVRLRPDDAKLQTALLAAFFGAEHSGHPHLKKEIIDADSWVILEDGRKEKREYVILNRGPARIEQGELLANDPRAKAFLGRCVGEVVTLGEGAHSRSLTVVQIRHAAVRAFQQVFLSFNDWFPSETAIRKVSIDFERLDGLSPLIENLQQHSNHVDEVLGLYRDRTLPLGVLARLLDADERTLQSELAGAGPMPPFAVEDGTPNALQQTTETALASKRVVLTLSAAITWQQLGMMAVLAKAFDELIVAQALVDQLDASVPAARLKTKAGAGTLLMRDGIPMAISADITAAQRDLESLGDLLRWLRTHCTVLPRPVGSFSAKKNVQRDALGPAAFDAVAIALELQIPLLADDLGLRLLGAKEAGFASFTSRGALERAKSLGLLSSEQHSDALISLVCMNHDFVPTSPELFLRAFSEAGFGTSGRLRALVGSLRKSRVDVSRAIGVSVATLTKAALSLASPSAVDMLAHSLFDALVSDRSPAVLAGIYQEINRQTELAPQLNARLLGALKAFAAIRLTPQAKAKMASR